MRKVLHLMGVITDQDVEWLVSHGQTRFVLPDQVVIRQGEPIDALFILLEGKLSVRKAGIEDREVAALHPGEVLGEISFVDARPPSASVVATQNCHLFVVNKDVLIHKLSRDDGFAARFYRAIAIFLADRLRTTTSHLGYGKDELRPDTDEIEDSEFDGVSMAAVRFDDMLRRLRINC